MMVEQSRYFIRTCKDLCRALSSCGNGQVWDTFLAVPVIGIPGRSSGRWTGEIFLCAYGLTMSCMIFNLHFRRMLMLFLVMINNEDVKIVFD